MHVQCLLPYRGSLMLQQRRGLIALRSLLHHCPLHFSLFFSIFPSVQGFSFLFLGGVSHKGQPVVGDGDAVTGDKGARIVSGLSLLPATKKEISAGDKCQLECAA